MGKLVVMPRTAPPPKTSNQEKRTREHLFPDEVKAMIKAAHSVGRHPRERFNSYFTGLSSWVKGF